MLQKHNLGVAWNTFVTFLFWKLRYCSQDGTRNLLSVDFSQYWSQQKPVFITKFLLRGSQWKAGKNRLISTPFMGILKIARRKKLFLILLIILFRSWVWVALTLLCATSSPFPLSVEELDPFVLPVFLWLFLFFLCANSLCISHFPLVRSLLPLSRLALKSHIPICADKGQVTRPSCSHLRMLMYCFLIEFAVCSLRRWTSTSAGWTPTWRASKRIWKINWKAATLKTLDLEAWKVRNFEALDNPSVRIEPERPKFSGGRKVYTIVSSLLIFSTLQIFTAGSRWGKF